MPAVPPSGKRRPAPHPLLLVALALFCVLGAAWLAWPRPPPPAPASGTDTSAMAAPLAQQAAPPPPSATAGGSTGTPESPAVTASRAPAPERAPAPPAGASPAPPAPVGSTPAPAPAPEVPASAVSAPPATPSGAPPPRTPTPAATPPVPLAAAAPPAAATPQPPDFDIVRIGPRGQAVIAGRAAPGAEVEVKDGGTSLGHARADARGEWVLAPDRPLPPGGRELTLTARGPDGTQVRGDASVVLVVPERGEAASGQPPAPAGALAVLTPEAGAAPRVLQAPPPVAIPPQPAPTAPPASAHPLPRGGLALEIVDYEAGGEVRFTGAAPPAATIRLYVDNAPVGDARAGADGRWTLSPASAIAPGAHTLRIDQISPQGAVVARLELPFQRADLPSGAVPDGKVVVQPGQSLWRIARAHYGKGVQYIVIYEANREAIRDPDLIYPGQIFDLPGPVH